MMSANGGGSVVDGFVRLFVSYCQYVVHASGDASGLGIHKIGDGLVHPGGPTSLTGFCGTHTGWIEARVRVLGGEPEVLPLDEWDAVSEATLWCPSGRFTVWGLMGGSEPELHGIAVPRGLIRVRVHARDRLHETVREEGDPPEQHEILVWPVGEDAGWRTLIDDRDPESGRFWEQKPAVAAAELMAGLLTPVPVRPFPRQVDPFPEDDDAGLPRVTVVRERDVSPAVGRRLLTDPVGALTAAGGAEALAAAGGEGAVPAGDLRILLREAATGAAVPGAERAGGRTLTWQWAFADQPIFPEPLRTLPDDAASTVRLVVSPDGSRLGVRNEGVLGRLAVTLGIVWDHLLDCLESGADPAPWETKLQAQAAEARERADRQRQVADDREARAWGGAGPTDRLRELDRQTHARPLAVLDRALLDRLAALPSGRQREVAVWAARRAVVNAGLDRADWVADTLALIETGQPLPSWLTENYGQTAFQRLFTDPGIPHTLITLPNGQPGFLQMSVAFPALTGLEHQDALAAAIEAVYGAAISHGDEHGRFLREAHAVVGETGDIDERG